MRFAAGCSADGSWHITSAQAASMLLARPALLLFTLLPPAARDRFGDDPPVRRALPVAETRTTATGASSALVRKQSIGGSAAIGADQYRRSVQRRGLHLCRQRLRGVLG